MKTKLRFLIKQSLDKKIKTKWFKAANILIAVCLIAIANVDRLITLFGGDFQNKTEVVIVDNVNQFNMFETNFKAIADSLGEMKNFEVVKSNQSIDEIKKDLNKDSDKFIVSLQPDEKSFLKAEVISYDPLDTITFQLVSTTLNQVKSSIVLETSGLTQSEISALTNPVEVMKNVTNEESKNQENKDIISTGLILVLIVPFFFLIIMLTQMIGAEINDEKSTRGMEIIISNVSPKTHFISKILASTLFVLLQGALLLIYSGIAFLIRGLISASGAMSVSGDVASSIGNVFNMVKDTGVLGMLLQGLPFILILFVVSFLAYAILAGVLASMTTSIEDYQQLQTPLMIILLVGYYIALMASAFEGALFIKVISFVPLISFLVAPVVFLLGQTTLIELGISAAICVVFTYFFFKYGLRIYKVGILNYSSSKLWKKIFKSVKQRDEL